tara:strand:+ start:958 stop:1113 length:156 start_codon:yes stop_codon:yes gene_type:complete
MGGRWRPSRRTFLLPIKAKITADGPSRLALSHREAANVLDFFEALAPHNNH